MSSRPGSFDAYYPGDAYVDWTGLDGYNYGLAWRSFSTLFGPSYADITRLTSKPLMVAEWGAGPERLITAGPVRSDA